MGLKMAANMASLLHPGQTQCQVEDNIWTLTIMPLWLVRWALIIINKHAL